MMTIYSNQCASKKMVYVSDIDRGMIIDCFFAMRIMCYWQLHCEEINSQHEGRVNANPRGGPEF